MKTNETKHTPGPWQIIRNGHFVGISNSVGKWSLAEVSFIPSAPADHCEANARLIAAAPELLAALEAVLEAMQGAPEFGEEFKLRSGWIVRPIGVVVAAIAKAKGEA